MLRWYLVRTKPRAEQTALLNLARQGYEAYFPRLRQLRACRTGGWRERIVPVFPGYVFLRLDEGRQALAPVQSTCGIAGVVRFGSRYAIVPEAVIESLRCRADPDTGLYRLEPQRSLAPGAAVRVYTGPFEGLEGIFDREAGAGRVIVLLSVLGRSTGVLVPAAQIVARQVA